MAKKTAIYVFKRDERSPLGVGRRNRASTDALGVVLNWATVEGRSYEQLIDQEEMYVASLTYDGEREQEAADDLNQRCHENALTREGITPQELESLRA